MHPSSSSSSSVMDDVDALLSESFDGDGGAAASAVGGSSFDSSEDDDAFSAYFGGGGSASSDPFSSFLTPAPPPSAAAPAPVPAKPQPTPLPASPARPPTQPPPAQHTPPRLSYAPPPSAAPTTSFSRTPITSTSPYPPPSTTPSRLPPPLSAHSPSPSTNHRPVYAPPPPAQPVPYPQAPLPPTSIAPQPHHPSAPIPPSTPLYSQPVLPSTDAGDSFFSSSTPLDDAGGDSFSSYFGADDSSSSFLIAPPAPAPIPSPFTPAPAPTLSTSQHRAAAPPPSLPPHHPPVPEPSYSSPFPSMPDAQPFLSDSDSVPDFLSYERSPPAAHSSTDYGGKEEGSNGGVEGGADVLQAVDLSSGHPSPSPSPATPPASTDNGHSQWVSPPTTSSPYPHPAHAPSHQPYPHPLHPSHHSTALPPPSSAVHPPPASHSSTRSYPLTQSPTLSPSPSSPGGRLSSVRSPHPIVSFSFGGRLVLMFPSLTPTPSPPPASSRSTSTSSPPHSSPQPMDEFELDTSLTSPFSSPSPPHSISSLTTARPGRIRLTHLSLILPHSTLPELSSIPSFPGPLPSSSSSSGRGKARDRLAAYISTVVQQREREEEVEGSRGGGEGGGEGAGDAVHAACYVTLMWKVLGTMLAYPDGGVERGREVARVLADVESEGGTDVAWKRPTPPSSSSSPPSQASQPTPGLLPLPTLTVPASMSSKSPSAASTVASSLALHEQKQRQHTVSTYLPVLLLQGQKEEAVRLALHHELFTDALLMSTGDRALHADVLSSITARMDDSSLTKAHYLVHSGMEHAVWASVQAKAAGSSSLLSTPIDALFASFPSSLLSLSSAPPLFASWRAHTALCAADPSPSDAAFLSHLGDYLWAVYAQPVAAHLCYLLSGLLPSFLSPIPAPSTRVVLLGGDHRRSLRLFTSLTPLQWTQTLDFICSLSPTPPPPSPLTAQMQVYSFLYASHIADLGLTDVALRYCQDISAALKTNQKVGGKDGASSSPLNPLFVYELRVLEHRLRVVLNAPASSPVRQKLVSGLLGVLDKGINMLVGDGTGGPVGGAGQAGGEKADWGVGGTKWEKPFASSLAPSSLTAAVSGGGQHPSSPGLHANGGSPAATAAAAVAPSSFSLPSAMLPRSSSSSNLGSQAAHQAAATSVFPAPTILRSSRSGDNLHSTMTAGEAGQVPNRPLPAMDAFTQAPARTHSPFPPLHPQPAAVAPTSSSPPSHAGVTHVPYQPHPPPGPVHQPPPTSTPAPAPAAPSPTSPSPPADGVAQANGPGLLRRLGSVGGLFSLWGAGSQSSGDGGGGGAEDAPSRPRAKPGVKEANLEQDHSFRWDEAQQRYIFVDREGKEVVDEPAPPPAAAPAPPPPLPPPPPPRPAMPGMPAYAARGPAVTNRYALSVGEGFVAPAQPLPMMPALAPVPQGGFAGQPGMPGGGQPIGFAQGRSPLPGVPRVGLAHYDPASLIAAPMPDSQ